MSLDNIQLPPATITALFRKTLVDLNMAASTEKKTRTEGLHILGKNGKGVIVVVNNNGAAFLPDEELNFLLGILNACKLNMDDVGILNLDKNRDTDYKGISAGLHCNKLFLFGTGPEDIKLPLSFPHYQVQEYNNQVYLCAPALSKLQNDKTEKTKLWNCLKQIFSL